MFLFDSHFFRLIPTVIKSGPGSSMLSIKTRERAADLISDALPHALLAVAATPEVMNWARVFGPLGRC